MAIAAAAAAERAVGRPEEEVRDAREDVAALVLHVGRDGETGLVDALGERAVGSGEAAAMAGADGTRATFDCPSKAASWSSRSSMAMSAPTEHVPSPKWMPDPS